MVSIKDLSLYDSILSQNLFSIFGSSLSFLLDGLSLVGLSFSDTNPSSSGLFLLYALPSFALQNTHISAPSRGEIGNYLLRADSVTSIIVKNCSFHVLDESSSSPISFIDIRLPFTSNSVTFSRSSFEGMRKAAGGGGFISVIGSGSLSLDDVQVSRCEA